MTRLSGVTRRFLILQEWVSYCNLPWFASFFVVMLKWMGSYRCENLLEVRQQFSNFIKESRGHPIIICSNHLTMIDSMLLIWFLSDIRHYVLDVKRFPWNLPEADNFGRSLLLRITCFLGKCIYVERSGSTTSRQMTLEKIKFVLRRGGIVSIFPEGGRSRTGRVDTNNAMYGVGEILSEITNCKVLCAYLRGDHQENYGFFPKRGDSFYLKLASLSPSSSFQGRRGARELTRQVMDQLEKMEGEYFQHRQ